MHSFFIYMRSRMRTNEKVVRQGAAGRREYAGQRPADRRRRSRASFTSEDNPTLATDYLFDIAAALLIFDKSPQTFY